MTESTAPAALWSVDDQPGGRSAIRTVFVDEHADSSGTSPASSSLHVLSSVAVSAAMKVREIEPAAFTANFSMPADGAPGKLQPSAF